MFEVSVAEEIAQVEMGRPHVVLLGAGASRAAFPQGEASGRRLPLMADFSDIVPIGKVLEPAGVPYKGLNFETVYSNLYEDTALQEVRIALDDLIYEYFSTLRLPETPTLYDHLVLSLRPKDVVATFNWDPFLMQAIRRNLHVTKKAPYLLFLHGNTAAGYCPTDGVHGVRGFNCSKCGQPFQPSRLLYPIGQKSYEDDPPIAEAWRVVRTAFEEAFMVSIFGYGAPQSDAAAITLLDEAWGGWQQREMEQFEIVDVREEDELVDSWSRFIHTHHYEVHDSIYDSWLFNHPRRTGEAYLNQYLWARFIEDNPIPRDLGFEELWAWFQPLLDREREGA